MVTPLSSACRICLISIPEESNTNRHKREYHDYHPCCYWPPSGRHWGCCGNYGGRCYFAALECWLHDCVCQCCWDAWLLVVLLKLHSRELFFNQHPNCPIQLLIVILEVAVLFSDSLQAFSIIGMAIHVISRMCGFVLWIRVCKTVETLPMSFYNNHYVHISSWCLVLVYLMARC